MNKIEEELYARAAQEVATKQMSPGVMAKAFVDAAGDEKRSIIFYIKMRVEQLKEELAEEIVRRKAEEKEAEKRRVEEQHRRVEQELRTKAGREELDVLNNLDASTRARYLKIRRAYGNRVLKSRVESVSQFRRRIDKFWWDYQREFPHG